ncbi:putative metallo-beta-lactamase family lipoprotein [Nocardioidaceae bacterium Broad-1]|uniref:N-acyl homoserine lactonase family protein n=1 Tax=Nocardioides luteus TaxID=1844 RepID=UPI0002028D7C|nr:N-acyl homoserine lactonase family protein [Nocardioides luteus]EGD45089.1 putative metallo-beta-lactamase family lipoprotein [Nocardioidaceae bacterium Broad-1]MBG6099302.1 glyoxylase-like metal-dependent hydrolase (beta-lactamase superfamily II) [Nocardioides luteus]
MASSDPISSVSVISTGSVAIRPEHVGPTRKNTYVWLFTSRQWTPPLPINVYVIEHRRGLVLFDTGQDRASVTDPDYFPGGLNGKVYSRLAKFEIAAEDTLTAGLQRLGHGTDDVRTAVISHLHQDHIGGLPHLGRSEIVVSRSEWDSLRRPLPEARGLMPRHIDLPGLSWNQVSFEGLGSDTVGPFDHGHDLYGDGSLVLLPTPGHTEGSLSLLVRRPQRAPLLMVGDLTYDDDLLKEGHLPGVGNKREMRTAADMVNRLREHLPGLVILPAHDPGAAARLAAAG